MRTPRSNFVVEYKMSRRQIKQRAASIWGDLDLQAVVRQIEADGSIPEHAPNPAVSPPPVRVRHASSTSIPEPRSEVDRSSILSTPESLPCQTQDDERPDDQSSGVPSAEQKRSGCFVELAKAGPQKRKGRGVNRNSSRQMESFEVLDQHISIDELELLEAENRQLKRLMLVVLREENALMKSMLNRFMDI